MMNTWNTWKLCSKASDSIIKCCFFQDSVEYLGSVVSKEGIQTSKRKIEALLKVKPPTYQTELKSFLGMVNHYGKFYPMPG